MLSEEDLVPPEDKKRRLKTPFQVQALEKFYNEQKYPSESMKSQFASKVGLSEKQISRWFCHRRLKDKNRLKDETCMSGKQDLSNSVLQDRGSGLRQDSCGSTKQVDYKQFDPIEVQSRRFYEKNYQSAVLASENKGRHMHIREYGTLEDTSSGSSSGTQDKLLPSRYSSRDNSSMLMNTEGVKGRGYMMASEYLCLQDEIENPAISAVKKQLGRHYREDGPPIGVEFQPLPPGAFDFPIGDPTHVPYYVGDPSLQKSHSLPRVSKETNAGMVNSQRHKSHPRDLYPEEAGSRRTMWESDHQKEFTHHPSAVRSFTSRNYYASDRNTVMKMDGDSAGEASEFNSKYYGTSSNHRVEGRTSSNKDGIRLYSRKVNANEPHYPSVQNNSGASHVFQNNEYLESEAPNSILQQSEPLNAEDKVQSRRMTKLKKLYKEKRMNKEFNNPLQLKTLSRNEVKMGKRLKGDEFRGLDSTLKAPSQELRWTKPIRGSAGEMPTSFSEDETASSNSSME